LSGYKIIECRKLNRSERRRSSKLKPILDTLDELKVSGDAIDYSDEKSVNSMTTAVSHYNLKKVQ
jgi:hypothetical protein